MARPPQRVLGPLQTFFYVVQTSSRKFDKWIDKRMIGLPNPPLTEEEKLELERNKPVDLWKFTMLDHIRFAREAWIEYKLTFSEEYSYDDRLEVKAKEIKKTLDEEAAKLDKHIEVNHPELKANLNTIKSEIKENIQLGSAQVKEQVDNLKLQAKDIDVERIPEHIADAVNAAKNRPIADVKNDVEEWTIDKLMVGRMTLGAFIDGYKEGKEEEINRETPLLKELAEKATERHKDFLESKRNELLEKVNQLDDKTKPKV